MEVVQAERIRRIGITQMWYCVKCDKSCSPHRAGILNVCSGCLGTIYNLCDVNGFRDLLRAHMIQVTERNTIATERDELHDRIRKMMQESHAQKPLTSRVARAVDV